MTLRIASYNIHKCVGVDRRRDPHRIIDVLNTLDADVIALQEVDRRRGARPAALSASLIEAETDFRTIEQPRTGPDSLGWHGQAFLVKRGVEMLSCAGIELPGLEPRGALHLSLKAEEDLPFSIFAAHLGLRRTDRRAQWTRIAKEMLAASPSPALAIGDFNEWSGRNGFEALGGFTVHAPGATYPSVAPVGKLDRIVTCNRAHITHMSVHDTQLTRRASDHLPIWADIGGLRRRR
ncbi:endonuclease/exonuclease/phosphatase family protein [Thioclava sp. GXIMD4215]|uniref:endonuclease/exonuclease/phosphatase family protein n=1 Tax=Thioclava sp. GXIMD4215 TaxID=3131928 RepID=UPI00325600DB